MPSAEAHRPLLSWLYAPAAAVVLPLAAGPTPLALALALVLLVATALLIRWARQRQARRLATLRVLEARLAAVGRPPSPHPERGSP